jgi:hypothetical protein
VTRAVDNIGEGFQLVEIKAYNTSGGRCVAVKATMNVSDNKAVHQLISAKLAEAGLTVLKTRNTWFDWQRGGMGQHVIFFYLNPKTHTVAG